MSGIFLGILSWGRDCSIQSVSDKYQPPDWLLKQLFINKGIFNDDRTAIISGFETPEIALDTNADPPKSFEINLASRRDWEAIRERLIQEGFL